MLTSKVNGCVVPAVGLRAAAREVLLEARRRAARRALVVPHAAWMAAAERVAVDDPLLDHLPVGRGASVKALGQVWKSRRNAQVNGSDPTAFCADGVDVRDAHLLLADTPATKLLKRVLYTSATALSCSVAMAPLAPVESPKTRYWSSPCPTPMLRPSAPVPRAPETARGRGRGRPLRPGA